MISTALSSGATEQQEIQWGLLWECKYSPCAKQRSHASDPTPVLPGKVLVLTQEARWADLLIKAKTLSLKNLGKKKKKSIDGHTSKKQTLCRYGVIETYLTMLYRPLSDHGLALAVDPAPSRWCLNVPLDPLPLLLTLPVPPGWRWSTVLPALHTAQQRHLCAQLN